MSIHVAKIDWAEEWRKREEGVKTTPPVQLPVQRPPVRAVGPVGPDLDDEGLVGPDPDGGGVWEWMRDIISGDERREFDIPELQAKRGSPEQRAKMLLGYLSSADPKQIADIAVKTLPGATQRLDKFENPVVTFEDKDYYVNAPGASFADLVGMIGQTAAYFPAAKWAGLAKTVLGGMFKIATTSAATSAALDVVSGELGGEQPISGERALVAAGAGALFQGLAPAAVKLWRRFFSKPLYYNSKTGELTPKGRRAAVAAGFNPDDMGDDLSQVFAAKMKIAADPEEAAALSAGQEFGIPMTRAQATADAQQIAREQATAAGFRGEESGRMMRDFADAQQTAMQRARGEVQARLAGGEPSISPSTAIGDTGRIVGEGLKGRAATARLGIDEAYEATREFKAHFTGNSLSGLLRNIKKELTHIDIHPESTPNAIRALKRLSRLNKNISKVAKSRQPGPFGQGPIPSRILSPVHLREFESARSRIGNLIGSAKNRTDKRALVRIKSELDKWLDDAVDNALFAGDDAALALLKKARAARREYGVKYEPRGRGDAAGKTIQKIIHEEQSPEQIVNWVFGKGKLGAKAESSLVAQRLKDIYGADGSEWNAIREMAWVRLTRELGEKGFSPTKYISNLKRALEENDTLMKVLFDMDEIKLFQRLATEVKRTVAADTAPVARKALHSFESLFRELAGRIGTQRVFAGDPAGALTFFVLKRIPALGKRGTRKALQLMKPSRPKVPQIVAPLTAGAARTKDELGW